MALFTFALQSIAAPLLSCDMPLIPSQSKPHHTYQSTQTDSAEKAHSSTSRSEMSHADMNHSEMDHANMNHGNRDHSKGEQMPADGSHCCEGSSDCSMGSCSASVFVFSFEQHFYKPSAIGLFEQAIPMLLHPTFSSPYRPPIVS